jgi:hypothetical protein
MSQAWLESELCDRNGWSAWQEGSVRSSVVQMQVVSAGPGVQVQAVSTVPGVQVQVASTGPGVQVQVPSRFGCRDLP